MNDSDSYVCTLVRPEVIFGSRVLLSAGISSSLADTPHAANYDRKKYQCWSELGIIRRNSRDKGVIRHGTQLQQSHRR